MFLTNVDLLADSSITSLGADLASCFGTEVILLDFFTWEGNSLSARAWLEILPADTAKKTAIAELNCRCLLHSKEWEADVINVHAIKAKVNTHHNFSDGAQQAEDTGLINHLN
ncbi:MAG: hypothetical protein Q7U43_13670 [Methylococcaceae bacterium]|nr:hypothetical protein [Methylococcaceae bacterium]